ncbi:MAG: hypothetical protein LBL34_04385 [Clostridiales bacterium]|nr:hypothetical protein [Clostridiales bacterium]
MIRISNGEIVGATEDGTIACMKINSITNEWEFFEIYDTIKIRDLSQAEYLQKLYGADYQLLQSSLPCDLMYYSFAKNSDVTILCYYQESVIRIFDNKYSLIWEDSDKKLMRDTIYSVALEKNAFWVAYPTSNIIAKYSLDNQEKLLELTKRDGLCYPESICVQNDGLYICNMGTNKLLKYSDVKGVRRAIKFKEPIWEYVVVGNLSYVRLKSGIYLIQ